VYKSDDNGMYIKFPDSYHSIY